MMKRYFQMTSMATLSMLLFACGTQTDDRYGPEYTGPNPFLEFQGDFSEDSGYLNLAGRELHVTLEADVSASEWRIFDAPPELAQFAVTYLRKRHSFYLEIVAEDTTAPDRVEWLVDGEWLTRQQANQVERSKLTHFRMKGVNAVVMGSDYSDIREGKVYDARVPKAPYSIMADAEDKCADYDSHIDLSQSVYWYLWNPGKSDCPDDVLQTMTLTVEELLPNNPESYPEYDKLWEDNQLTVAVFWGKLDDGDVKDDYNWSNFRRIGEWLLEAGFTCETEDPPEGQLPQMKRYKKTIGDLTEIVDVFGPNMFHSVADYSRFNTWQQAVSTHEVVMYNGHSVLGTGMAFERVSYPGFYQVFQVASCLSYEYYVRPVLQGKGSWEKVDVVSNVDPTYYSENLPLTSTILARLFYGFENGGEASWQDVMSAVARKMYHKKFGVSGARGNCFSPEGDLCDPDPEAKRYANNDRLDVPDNDSAGVASTIEITDDLTIEKLSVEIDLAHTYIGDLKIALAHDGVTHSLWNRDGGSSDDIRETFNVTAFDGKQASGTWTLHISDHASRDLGTLVSWTLVVTPGEGGGGGGGSDVRFENTSRSEIPDNDDAGVSSSIEVADSISIRRLKVELDITHSYIGDLKIVLTHNGTRYALWDSQGGGSDDIKETFQPSAFDGMDAQGTWELHIVDQMNLDEGSLNKWALVITPDE